MPTIGRTHLDKSQGAAEQRTEAYIEYAEGAAQTETRRFAKSDSRDSGSAAEFASVVRTYYRLTKPGIIYGNIITATAGFLLASKTSVDIGLLLTVIVGTALVIASACVFNNYIDRGIDQKMSRTEKRALASGLIPTQNALIFASILGILGFLILYIYTNAWVIGLGIVAFIDYIVLYGIAKRISRFGTQVGTIAGAAPIAAGYLAVTNRLDSAAIILFLIMVMWQMAHFYAIAIFRLKDYKAAGIPVFSAKNGVPATKKHILFYIAAFTLAASALSIFGYTGYTYLLVIVSIGIYWLYKGASSYRTGDAVRWARSMFGYSLTVLLVFCAAISLDRWLP